MFNAGCFESFQYTPKIHKTGNLSVTALDVHNCTTLKDMTQKFSLT